MRIARAVVACLVLTAGTSYAEKPKPNAEDVVNLKDGTIVTGKILDDDPKAGVTIKMSNGKVQVIPTAKVKSTERGEAAPAKRAPPPDEPDAPPPPPPKKEPPKPDDGAGKRPLLGVGADLGAVMSSNNADGAIKLLSPSLGVHATFAGSATPSVYFLADVGISTFSRKSAVTQPARIDTSQTPLVVTNQEIATKNRALLFTVAPQAGYEISRAFSVRGGLVLGYARTSGSSEAPLHPCDSGAQGGLVYGARLVPAAYRGFGSVEIAATFDYLWVPMPRCFVPGLDKGLKVQGGGVTEIYPTLQNKTIAVGTLGLNVTYSFK